MFYTIVTLLLRLLWKSRPRQAIMQPIRCTISQAQCGRKKIKRMMKKSLAVLLVLSLMLGTGLGALSEGASAAPFTQNIFPEGQSINSTLSLGDELLVNTADGLYTLPAGGKELLSYGGVTREDWSALYSTLMQPTMLADGDQLYLFDALNGMLSALSIDAGKPRLGEAMKLDLSSQMVIYPGMDQEMLNSPEQTLIHEKSLYLLYKRHDTQTSQSSLLVQPLSDGAPRVLEMPELQAFTPYKEGKFLGAMMDQAKAWDEASDKELNYRLVTFDPLDGKLTELGSSGLPYRGFPSIAYDAQADASTCWASGKYIAGTAMARPRCAPTWAHPSTGA